MTRLERGLLGLHAGAWLSLLAVSVLSLALGPALPLLSPDVGGGRWAFLVGWLLLGTLMALPREARRAWQLTCGLTAAGLLTLAGLGAEQGGLLMRLALLTLAVVMLGMFVLLQRAQVRKQRPGRRKATTAPRPRPARPAWLMLGWGSAMTSLVSSFALAWLGSDADLRGRGAVLLLVCGLVVVPALSAAYWAPRLALLGVAIALLIAVGQFSPGSASLTICLTALALSVASMGLRLKHGAAR